VNDLRAIPDRLLKAYLYAVVVWVIGLALLFAAGFLPYALWLSYPLALWFAILTIGWWIRATPPELPEPLRPDEVTAGTRTIGRIVALAGLLPGAVFLADDPLSAASWSTVGGVLILGFAGVALADRAPSQLGRPGQIAVLGACLAVLPLTAASALSVAWFIGLFDKALALVPT